MNKIIIHKADALTERDPEIPDCVIEISAQALAGALFNHLPQGIFEPLLVEMMKHRISLYRGTGKSLVKEQET